MKVALIIHSNILDKVDGMANYYRKICQIHFCASDIILSNFAEGVLAGSSWMLSKTHVVLLQDLQKRKI
jgi:hypothetical protein